MMQAQIGLEADSGPQPSSEKGTILMSGKKTPSHHGPHAAAGMRHPNSTIGLLLGRASCRSFTARAVSDKTLEVVLRAGTRAPTAGNLQPYSVIVVRDRKARERLGRLCWQPFIGKAPVNLLFCLDLRRLERWAKLEAAPFTAMHSFRHFWVSFQDVIICAQNICTAADALGLGSVYIGTAMEFIPRLRRMFRLPRLVFPVVLLAVGWPSKRPLPRGKLGPETVAHRERYRDLGGRELAEAFRTKYQGQKLDISPERLKRIEKVCLKVHGESFARRCLARIRKQGFISMAQRYYGLHYSSDVMPQGNEKFLKAFERAGFGWFRDYKTTIKK
jgi:FMN reductase [NAD(P)H]